jgi:hypothetical protein
MSLAERSVTIAPFYQPVFNLPWTLAVFVRETDEMKVAQQFIAGLREGEGESVERTTEVCARLAKTSAVRFTDSSFPSFYPSTEVLGYLHGVRFADASAGFQPALHSLVAWRAG